MTTHTLNTLCSQHQAVFLREDEHSLYIAVARPPAEHLLGALRFTSNKQVHVSYWSAEQLEKASLAHPEGPTPGQEDDPLETILAGAIARRASDIHIEPGDGHLTIRLRVDGVLQQLQELPAGQAAPLLARLKISAGLDIAERRLPQDGQFSTSVAGTTLALRLSTLPCRYGEKAVLRLQAPQAAQYSAEIPGMTNTQQALWQRALSSPQGLILVTGPTGSGKTRTLYAGLHALNRSGVNICSVEDPVEIPIPGINQTQINTKAGLDFPLILRALLRQDPDIIMIGEIRDAVTADIAIKAAQTGHLVLSTLHTNSTTETVIRLQQMGIPGWMLASTLRLIVAQRLVRRLCPHCRQPASEPAVLTSPAGKDPGEIAEHWLPRGCERCYSGYYGREALFEMLPPDPAMRQAIIRGADSDALARQARDGGHPTLARSAHAAIRQGVTSVSEVWRVMGDL
ncbi:ATPase, T2SS/T4P/T4SS family [Shimwellia blattae]|uniref:Putative typ II secretion system protein E n=1 Tax=Shimwellia blattae (strain ATCC 29907 / DSM 4481 / JCM 1650 / NBRC 105725 / CDC 9005-74) TaxID=630626 RepID=I2BCR0_SHIBC|nr:ATPase, T2SS/T4P/T4SS family [Shimwellia blattae]AFJ48314.1 putative typ II secretion system protein E [Shimwellia blattae DSM 4481 = NBRC 105725]GAB81008.1 HofB protein [Shimwellia blattae DSM 4481 = NBRC 105725]VDY65809.1 Type II traffic warden ATPase [Shimwellia blattae]VEC25852.1 Type II traffic warden ATPase [Shimwellia blattae]